MTKLSNVLLVDDNRMDVELTLDAFRQVGHADLLRVVRGGQQALDYLFGRGEYADRDVHPLPDLVLLDLKMPVVDGIEVLRQVKSTPLIRRIPIIILTSSCEEGDRAMSYDLGANSYLVKPISFEGFIDMASRINGYWIDLNTAPPEP
ncbi:MAG: response regulator [Lysobacteraceae bacterium]